jgi:hypothetical protein
MEIVISVPLSAKKFTQKDLNLSQQYISTHLYPGLYKEEDLPKGMKFVDRRIMDIEDISLDNPSQKDVDSTNATGFTWQMARYLSRGANAEDVHASIERYGYKLDKVPMSVVRMPDGKNHICNGKTRLEKLIASDFKNIIVDYYTSDSWDSFNIFAVQNNRVSDPYSPHTKDDVISHCRYAVLNGIIKKTYDDIRKRIDLISNGSFHDSTKNKIALAVLEGDAQSPFLLAFTEKSAKDWLNTNGYRDNIDNNGIYYKVMSTSFHSKAITNVAKYLNEDLKGKQVKELRLVIHTDTLDGSDGEKCWKGRLDTFRKNYKASLEYIKASFFWKVEQKDVVKLYAALPAVYSLVQEYPMDRLVLFHNGKLKNDTYFSEIDSYNNNIDKFLQEAA